MKTLEPAVALSLKNILLATDFSPVSGMAVKYAQAIARRHASRVHTIHVTTPDSYHLLDPDAFAITFNRSTTQAENIPAVLHGLLEGLPSETPLRQGTIWKVISDVVERNEIDLLILASHGRHGISRMVLGSVAEDVFRNVSCPVLTVGPDVRPCHRREMRIKNVLLATHFEKGSTAPMYAARLCNEFGAELTLLHVAEGNGHKGTTETRALSQRLYSVVPAEAELWRQPVCVIKHGLPSAQILEVARESGADLIVLGARHPEPAKINSHLPWATAARVIAEAACPVLTVRQRDGYEF
ncbi:MAG TPA: universal stress protein [Candidatus Angelobacter sp.]|jgi:nucleotide-binding universal stress UspA family protein|nr:universal stress protein [Candidatus Angelobacter sp.]